MAAIQEIFRLICAAAGSRVKMIHREQTACVVFAYPAKLACETGSLAHQLA